MFNKTEAAFAVLDRIHAVLRLIAMFAVSYITVMVSLDVGMRNAGLGSLAWVYETSEYCLVALTFAGAPWVLRLGAHIRVDFLLAMLPPGSRRWADRIAALAGLAVALVLLWVSVGVALESQAQGSLMIKQLVFPEWWIFAGVAFGAALLVLEFLRQLLFGPATGGAGHGEGTGL